MLILGRKVGESLSIGEQITITILSVDAGGNVSIGINAPKDLLILRSELKVWGMVVAVPRDVCGKR